MKRYNIITLIFAVILFANYAIAQEHKINIKSGTIVFDEISNLAIEGYSGSEVIITSTGKPRIPEKAKGLNPVNSLGMQDNTGIGLAVVKATNDFYEVHQIIKDGKYTVQIPANVKVQVKNVGVDSREINVKNLSSDVEVSSRYSNVNLENISGPVLVNTIHGNVNAKFTKKVNFPVSIISMHGEVDIALSADLKADLRMNSSYGNIFTDMPIVYEKPEEASKSQETKAKGLEPSTSGAFGGSSSSASTTTIQGSKVQSSGDSKVVVMEGVIFNRKANAAVKGKINGGGGEVLIESRHNNIYLRKL
jgi:hypothetical protein